VGEFRSVLRVNGAAVPGIRVLGDKDEICAPQLGRLYFSAERLAKIEPFAGPDDDSVTCPRCLGPLKPGHLSVRCPKCSVVHHEMEDKNRPCWTYKKRCAHCDQPTRLDAGLQWRPEPI
jgi:hypothetical protein